MCNVRDDSDPWLVLTRDVLNVFSDARGCTRLWDKAHLVRGRVYPDAARSCMVCRVTAPAKVPSTP